MTEASRYLATPYLVYLRVGVSGRVFHELGLFVD